jgi:hypothetical protein
MKTSDFTHHQLALTKGLEQQSYSSFIAVSH